MMQAGFVPQLLLMQSSSAYGTSDFVVRRHVAQALAALSLCCENKGAMQACGALPCAAELLRAKDRELRRQGGGLSCNLALHPPQQTPRGRLAATRATRREFAELPR